MLLSAGEASDDEAEINQAIAAGKQLAGKVTIMAFGIGSGMLSWSAELVLVDCNSDNILELPYDVTSGYVNAVTCDLNCNPEYFTVKCVIIN